MATFSTEGVVLSHSSPTDSGRLVTLYTWGHGKLQARLRGSHKTLSKLAGNMEPFCDGLFFLAHGPGGYTVIGVDAASPRSALKRKLQTTAAASIVAEAVIRLTHDQQPDRRLFAVVQSVFSFLDQKALRTGSLLLLITWFFLRFFSLQGSGLEFSQCVRCRKKLTPGTLSISFSLGGALCGECGRLTSDAQALRADTLKLFRLLNEAPLADVLRVKTSTASLVQALNVVSRLYRYHLEDSSPAQQFFQALS